MKSIRLILLFIVLITISFSCNKSDQPAFGAVEAILSDYAGLDGCSWVIKLENGEILEPANLHDFSFDLKEGKNIWVKYRLSEDQVSICMVGPIVTVENIWER